MRLAVVGLAKSLSIEFAHEGIMVNCLCPGPFATDRMEYLVKSSMEIDGLDRAAAEKLWLELKCRPASSGTQMISARWWPCSHPSVPVLSPEQPSPSTEESLVHTDNKPQKNDRMDGGGAIVAWLKNAGVKNVFSVSGGPINAVYRACANQGLPLIHARHEAAACFMAEAQSRVTGKAGAAVVTLGPGVTNAVTPGLVATLAGTPIIIVWQRPEPSLTTAARAWPTTFCRS